ncbi:MAG TPA: DUF695 domain-containing protein [Puia sp.]|nr:DUF695 domain-containing protein [Puia sp.]
MSFFKKIFGSKTEHEITDPESFWKWFLQNENAFFSTLKNQIDVNKNFVEKVMEKLKMLSENFYCVAGMYDDKTAELIITPEGSVKTIVFVEDLIAAAPALVRWRFTALKPAVGVKNSNIEMDGYSFSADKIHFISNHHEEYPDEIDITLVHKEYNEEDKNTVVNGCFIFLDNALGELMAVTQIDSVNVKAPDANDSEPIQLEKLNDYLVWREKEFIEKYSGMRHDTDDDNYCTLEAKDDKGLYSLAIVNEDLLKWDATASHPWMLVIEIKYDGSSKNGMPDEKTYEAMNDFDDILAKLLVDSDGYLNLGRSTYDGTREIYVACREFRNSSRIVFNQAKYFENRLNISYEIYKDKYWVTMNRYRQHL